MSVIEPHRIKTIYEFHQLLGLPTPKHLLISVINLADIKQLSEKMLASRILDFYTITLKHSGDSTYKYGQQQYNIHGGVMYFISPGQVCGPLTPIKEENKTGRTSGWGLYIHPDFLWNTPLAKEIRKYEYFNYSVNEALYLSEEEEDTIIGLMQTIQKEYFTHTDNFSQDIIISMVEVLLNFSNRFYHRQFLTRKTENYQLLNRLEDLLISYFDNTDLAIQELPSVQFIAERLNISPNYLSSLLKALTGRNTQQHIQDRIIEKAKVKLSTTELSVSEISYVLGFEHPQSFSRLFKAKSGLSPLGFRQIFKSKTDTSEIQNHQNSGHQTQR
ncbi:AraC family transcriptional regulator [Xanthocytophaga flava]|uniref:AraC family transcriptional regulator n=1 Tax=Xanthocytophaga flava TaxID=3048013 RepID=UPI0028D12C1D|nr:AraC family transcriptional regulator [Xanthocytophaga flavus]MDJ1467318.1 AraC family transcriptional regulator [Xanthocytophaga flavus]